MIDFDEVIRREADGSLLVGVHRSVAQQFWAEVPLKEIEIRTGEAPYTQKAIIYLAFVGGPVLLLASIVRAPWVIGWWAALGIPLGLVFWIGFHGNSGRPTGRLGTITVAWMVVAAGTAFSQGRAEAAWQLGLLYVSSLWLSRLLYVASTSFFRYLVLHNRRAWEWLNSSLELVDASRLSE
jgi:hypothetical protein